MVTKKLVEWSFLSTMPYVKSGLMGALHLATTVSLCPEQWKLESGMG